MTRSVLLVSHTGREGVNEQARVVAQDLAAAGIDVRVLRGESEDLQIECADVVAGDRAAEGTELVLALGGDGTLLRAAELARPVQVPLLGVNLGHVGFLAGAEADDLQESVQLVIAREFTIDYRLTLECAVWHQGEQIADGWALNEVSVEKVSRERMLEVLAEIDGRPLSRWGCDGVLFATPTGSTAYAFSAGGPVVWPEVEALLMVPISAHALFARPMVTAPTSVLAVDILPGGAPALMSCDGRRTVDLPAGSRIEVRRGELPLQIARLHPQFFTDRLVAKFGLPVQGWRGRRSSTD